MKKDKNMIFRYDSVTGEELDYLCKVLSMTRSEVVRTAINELYQYEYVVEDGEVKVFPPSF